MIQAAAERKFEIVGEALNRLHDEYPEIARQIPQLRRIMDFRNLPSHDYDQVNPERVWFCTQRNLPERRRIVHALLAELGPSEE